MQQIKDILKFAYWQSERNKKYTTEVKVTFQKGPKQLLWQELYLQWNEAKALYLQLKSINLINTQTKINASANEPKSSTIRKELTDVLPTTFGWITCKEFPQSHLNVTSF